MKIGMFNERFSNQFLIVNSENTYPSHMGKNRIRFPWRQKVWSSNDFQNHCMNRKIKSTDETQGKIHVQLKIKLLLQTYFLSHEFDGAYILISWI